MEIVHSATLQLCLLLTYLVCGTTVWLLRGQRSRKGIYDRWAGAHLAGAGLYLALLYSPYLPSLHTALLACLLLLLKGSWLLGSFARLLRTPIPLQGTWRFGAGLMLLLAGLLLAMPPHVYYVHLAMALGIAALYLGSLAALLLQQAERPFPIKLAGGLCALATTYMLLYALHLGASDPAFIVYEIGPMLLLPVLVATPLLALCFSAIGKEQELALLRTLATLDPLTGIFNRRSFEELARKACAQHARQQRPLALLMIDLDHFKRINDTYGHSRGDMALKALAELIPEHVRTADIFGRFGGEEFCLLLPDTNVQGAREVASKLCQQINTILLEPGKVSSALSASIGVASLVPQHVDDWRELFELADSRLYRAKSAGRNQLVWIG